jgi:hypothetical protein
VYRNQLHYFRGSVDIQKRGAAMDSAKTVSITAFCICLSSTSIAQVTCGQLAELISAAPGAFHSLQGRRDPHDASFYAAIRTLPNAIECLVYHDEGIDSYDCTWEYPDRGSMAAAYESSVAFVRGCLPSSRMRVNSAGKVTFTVSDNGKYSIDVRVSQRESHSERMRMQLSVQRNSDD